MKSLNICIAFAYMALMGVIVDGAPVTTAKNDVAETESLLIADWKNKVLNYLHDTQETRMAGVPYYAKERELAGKVSNILGESEILKNMPVTN